MADIQSNIKFNVDTSDALANIKLLQGQISAFQTQMSRSSAAQAKQAQNLQRTLLDNVNATGKFNASLTTIKTTTESFTNSLEKNKLSMREYFRYSGGASKSFGRFFKQEFDTIGKVARERVKDLQTQYIQLGRDANGAMQAIKIRPLVLDLENMATKTAIAAQKQAMLNQLLKQGSTNLLNFGKNTQWAGRQLMVGFTIPLGIMGAAAAKSFMEMETATIKFQRVYGDLSTTIQESDAMVGKIKELASEFTKYGVSFKDTMTLAADAAAMGKQGADLMQQVTETSRLAVLGNVEHSAALETTTSLMDAFGISAENLGEKINFLNAVENQTVTSIEDLTIAVPKAGPVIKQLGGDVEDLAFFLTAMREGGINASEGANALKSGLASLINPTQKASDFMARFGINITGLVESNKGDVKGLVLDFADALKTLDPLNRARAIEQLFGKFQFARMSTLFQNVIAEGSQASKVLELTNATATELGMLAGRELGKLAESPMYKFQKAIADIQAQLAPVGEEFLKAVTPIVEFASSVLKSFNNLESGTKQLIVNIVGIVGGIGPIFLMTFGLIANGAANIIKLFSLMKSGFNKLGGGSRDLASQTQYMTNEQVEAAAIASSLDQAHNKLRQTFTLEAGALNQLTAAYQRNIAASGMKPMGPIRKFSSGGMVMGPGSGTSDSIPARLSDGEYVLRAKAVDAIGTSNLNKLNYADKFAIGGLVGRGAKSSKLGFGFIGDLFKNLLSGMSGKGSMSTSAQKTKYQQDAYVNFMRSNPSIAVRMQSQDFMDSLGRRDFNYRNRYERGFKPGEDYASIKDAEQRLKAEQNVFGISPDAPGSQRPVYGIAANLNNPFSLRGRASTDKEFAKSNVRDRYSNVNSEFLDRYGDMSLVLKNRVKKRSTFTLGDSYSAKNFNGQSPAVPGRFGTMSRSKILAADSENFANEFKFVEAQIFGGLPFSDIKKIIVKNPELIPILQSKLAEAGIKIPVGTSKLSFIGKLNQMFYKNKTYKHNGEDTGLSMFLPQYKNGGMVMGPGSGTSDSIPAMVSNGEFITSAKRTKQYLPLLQAIAQGKVPGYASPDGGSLVNLKGYTNAVHITSPEGNADTFDPQALSSELRAGGGKAFAPVVHEIARQLGGASQAEISRIIDNNPNLIDMATKANNAIADELSTQVGKIDQSTYSKIWQKHLRKQAQELSNVQQEALERVLTEVTTVEDKLHLRQRGKGTIEPRGRVGVIAGIPAYRDQTSAYLRTAEKFPSGVLPNKKVLAHGTGAQYGTLSEFSAGRQLSGNGRGLEALANAGMTSIGLRGRPGESVLISNAELEQIKQEVGGSLTAAVNKVLEQVKNGVREITKTKSPSREAENIGKDIGRGFINGAESQIDEARSAGQKVSSAVVSGATQSGGKRRRRASSGTSVILDGVGYVDSSLISPTMLGPTPGTAAQKKEAQKANRRAKIANTKQRISNYAQSGKLGGKISGAGFAASGVSAVASMAAPPEMQAVLGTISTVLSVVGMFGNTIAKIVPHLIKFAGPIGIVITAATALYTVFDLLTKESRERVEREKALNRAMTVTKGQIDSFASFFGKTVSESPYARNTSVSGGGPELATATEQLRADETFKEENRQTIEDLKNLSREQGLLLLQNLAIKLSPNFAPEQIQAIVDAIKQEAKRTDISLDVSKILITAENGVSGINSAIESAFKGLNSLLSPTNLANLEARLGFGNYEDLIKETFGEEQLQIMQQSAKFAANTIYALRDSFNKGVIPLELYNKGINKLRYQLQRMNPAQAKVTIQEIMKVLDPNISPQNSRAVLVLKNISDQLLVVEAMAVNSARALDLVYKINNGTATEAAIARAELEKLGKTKINIPVDTTTEDYVDPNDGGDGGKGTGPTQEDKLRARLQLIEIQEDRINKKYDERRKALEEVKKVQEEISAQQRDQLDLADALTRGDIAAAAKAAQQMRANNATRAIENQQKALEVSQNREVDALRDPTKFARSKQFLQDALQQLDIQELYKTLGMKAPAFGKPTVSVPKQVSASPTAQKSSVVNNSSTVNNSPVYNITVTTNSNASPGEIATIVTDRIKSVESQRIQGSRLE
jgi:TP901 family phage tail tape measure protein